MADARSRDRTAHAGRVRLSLRWLAWLATVAAVLLAAVGAGALFLSRTASGRDLAAEWALGRLESSLAGTLEIGSVGPGNLWGGATVYDVSIRDSQGNAVVTVDSVRARYSLLGLLHGVPTIVDLRLWSPVVVSEPGPDGTNALARAFAGPGPEQASGGAGQTDLAVESGAQAQAAVGPNADSASSSSFVIRTVRVYDGTVVQRDVLGTERRVAGIEGTLSRVEFAPSPDTDFAAEVDRLSLDYSSVNRELTIAMAKGAVEATANRIVLEADDFRLRESSGALRATVEKGETGEWRADLELAQARVALTDAIEVGGLDADWLRGGLSEGIAAGEWRIGFGPDGILVGADRGVVRWGEGEVALSGGVSLADSMRFQNLSVSADDVDAADVAQWLPFALLPGSVAGTVRIDGPLENFVAEGDLALVTGRDTLAALTGRGTVLGRRALRDLALRATIQDYRLAQNLDPRFPWTSRGRSSIELQGDLPSGMTVRAAASRTLETDPPFATAADGPPPSGAASPGTDSVFFAATLYGDDEVALADGEATVRSLSLAALDGLSPAWSRLGTVQGTLSVSGPLENLDVAAEFATSAGVLETRGTVSSRDSVVGYDLSVSSPALELSRLVPGLPEPTVFAGSARVSGRGLDPETARGTLSLSATSSAVGPVSVDTAEATLRADDGLLRVESLFAEAGGVVMQARGGTLGAAPGAAGNGVLLSIASPSIRPLRSVFMGENLVAWDELSPVEQQVMVEFDGVDPDTLPVGRDIRFDGSMEGELRLSGSLSDLRADLSLAAEGFEYGPRSAGAITVEMTARDLRLIPSRAGGSPSPAVLSGWIAADSVSVWDREFRSVRAEGVYALDGTGRASAVAVRSPEESYEAQAEFSVAGDSGQVDLDRLLLKFGDRRWSLQGPASFRWDPGGLVVNDFGLLRPGSDGLRLRADGRLAKRTGDSSFELEASNLDLALLGRLLQADELPEGRTRARLSVRGSADSPLWDGAIQVRDAALGLLRFDSVAVEGSYRTRAMALRGSSWTGGQRTLAVEGNVPLDLRFAAPAGRIPDEPVDVSVSADSFPLGIVLGVMAGLEEASGSVTGDLRIRGRPAAPAPEGVLRVEDGALFLEGLGVEFAASDLHMAVRPDASVTLEGSARSGSGTMRVRGTVDASDPSDPGFDLAFWPREFQVVNRRDLEAAVTGDSVTLTGSFTEPLIQGLLQVDGGTVYTEEFQRSAQTLNFYDPVLFEAATQRIGSDGAVTAARNPFLANLRVDVDLSVGRGNWLRSRDLNIETEGDLSVVFDRQANQLVLLGSVDVVRGTYTGLPRSFAMTEGRFRFVGTPGFNPNISVTAENRLRTRHGEPLVITANISGTLLSPRLRLSSDAGPTVSQDDLYSYLLIGEPASALVGQAQSTSLGAGLNLLAGQVANQLGYLLASELKLDQLSVSQAERSQAAATLGASSLQLQLGRYLMDDVFLTGIYQRGYCADPALPVNSGGARVEVGMPRGMTLEGFFENRCTREGMRGLGGLSLERAWIWGFSFYREWGY